MKTQGKFKWKGWEKNSPGNETEKRVDDLATKADRVGFRAWPPASTWAERWGGVEGGEFTGNICQRLRTKIYMTPVDNGFDSYACMRKYIYILVCVFVFIHTNLLDRLCPRIRRGFIVVIAPMLFITRARCPPVFFVCASNVYRQVEGRK